MKKHTFEDSIAEVRAVSEHNKAMRDRLDAVSEQNNRPPLIETAPRSIYLNVSDDTEHYAEPFPDSIDDEVTWSADMAVDCAVKYVRADVEPDLSKVTRFEVIDHRGRVYVSRDVRVELSYQDDGRTLKVFVSNLHPEGS